jgi:hypothetical protein
VIRKTENPSNAAEIASIAAVIAIKPSIKPDEKVIPDLFTGYMIIRKPSMSSKRWHGRFIFVGIHQKFR